jgi:hypothetical protein
VRSLKIRCSPVGALMFAAFMIACDSGGPAVPERPSVASVRVSPAAVVLQVGAARQYTARAYDAASNELMGRTVMWGTSTPAVVSVGSDGLVRGAGAGYGDVSASVDGVTAAVGITVVVPEERFGPRDDL